MKKLKAKSLFIFVSAFLLVTTNNKYIFAQEAESDSEFAEFDEEFSETESSNDTEESNDNQTSSTSSEEESESSNEEDVSDLEDLEELEDDKDSEQESAKKEEVLESEEDVENDEFLAEEDLNEENKDELNEDNAESAKIEDSEPSVDSNEIQEIEPKEEDNSELAIEPEVPASKSQTSNQTNNMDDPDLSYETELFDIYQKFHSAPMPDKDWDFIAGSKMSEAYTIQRGDSLWDLSKTFFGDGNFWPKIWSINSKITNPHLIETGNVIRFILGNENDAPMFAVTEEKEPMEGAEEIIIAEEEQVETNMEDVKLDEISNQVKGLEKELSEEFTEAELEEELLSDEEIEGVVIPPPEAIIRPVTQVFPPSIPQWKSYAETVLQSREVNFKNTFKKQEKSKPILSYYIDENQPKELAKVVAVEGGGQVAAQYQYIYIRAKKGTLKEGENYLVTQNKGPLIGDHGVQEDAIIWEVQGKIKIDHQVEATKKYRAKNFEVFRAYVVSALNALTVGADVIQSDYIYIDDTKAGRVPAASGLIIGGSIDNKRSLLSKESIAYLNVGINEGVEAGDMLPIYANNYLEQFDPYVLTTKKPMGLIKIIKVSEYYSTGFVVENNGSISIGDFVGLKEGFEKEFLGKSAYEKKKKEETDKEIEEIQSLISGGESENPSGEQENFEFVDEESKDSEIK